MEAAFKEKEFDSYFSLALGVQGARNIFVTEVGKHIEVYIEQSDNANSSLLVKKIFKNLLDTHFVRKLKISREAKIDKIYNHLFTKNEEVLGHITRYVSTRTSVLAQYQQADSAVMRSQEPAQVIKVSSSQRQLMSRERKQPEFKTP